MSTATAAQAELQWILPVFLVEDPKATAEYYRDKLGFRICGVHGEPPVYAIVDRGCGRGFHFKRTAAPLTRRQYRGPDEYAWDSYIEVKGVDALHAELVARGARILRAPEVAEYGMKEFDVEDCNGYILCFAEVVALAQ
jgi:catechol 2,3-dioxygenase-like lactoylglutathione lyase family enzyme